MELEKNINSYLPFLHEWSQQENCSLNSEDINLIETHLNKNFKINFIERILFFNQVPKIKGVIAKLIWDYQKFKDWLITNFVFSLVKIAKDNNFNNLFFHLPLDYTSITYQVKSALKLFKIKTFYEFFEKYNEQDLYKENLFNNIIEFETVFKKDYKPINPKKNKETPLIVIIKNRS